MAAASTALANTEDVKDPRQDIIESYASTGSWTETGNQFGLHPEQVRRVVRSTQGSFQLEQLLRDRARSRALKLGSLTDRTINEWSAILDRGEERVLTGRREDDPLTIWCRPGLRDVVNALAWATHHMRELADTLSSIDVTNHDVSHEARSHNLQSLRELVAQEERRLHLDAQRALASPGDADTGSQSLGSSGADAVAGSSGPDAVARLIHPGASTTDPPSVTRPSPRPPTRETGTETPGDIRTLEEVTWDDLD